MPEDAIPDDVLVLCWLQEGWENNGAINKNAFMLGKGDADGSGWEKYVSVWDRRRGIEYAIQRAQDVGRPNVGLAGVSAGAARAVEEAGTRLDVRHTAEPDPAHLGIYFPPSAGRKQQERMARGVARSASVLVRNGAEPWRQRLTAKGQAEEARGAPDLR